MSSYYNNGVSDFMNDKRGLDIDSSIWSAIHYAVRENQDFFDNNKNSYINRVIYSDYTVNADIIPIIPLAITKYMVIIKSNIYNKSRVLELLDGGEDYKNYFSFKKLRLSLSRVLKDYNLHDVGFLMIDGGSSKLSFKNLNPIDLVYNYDFTSVIVKLELVKDYEYRYIHYKQVNSNSWKCTEFIAGDWSGINYEYLKGNVSDNSGMRITRVFNIKEMPIIPLFKTANRVAQKSVFVYADLILNLLLGFGLANVPNALLVKIWIKNAKSVGSIDMDDKLGALSDILDVLPLGENEDAGTLDLGRLEGFKNFFAILESLLTHIAQLEGIPRSAMQIANPTRQSGASKQTDNRTSSIYRDYFLMELDEYEEQVFGVINNLLDKSWEFKSIDKSMSITMSSSEILEEQILAVTNGFEDFVVAIAKYQNISKEEARKYLDDIMKSREKYGELLTGIAGMPMSDGGAIATKKDEGVYKGDKKVADEKVE